MSVGARLRLGGVALGRVAGGVGTLLGLGGVVLGGVARLVGVLLVAVRMSFVVGHRLVAWPQVQSRVSRAG